MTCHQENFYEYKWQVQSDIRISIQITVTLQCKLSTFPHPIYSIKFTIGQYIYKVSEFKKVAYNLLNCHLIMVSIETISCKMVWFIRIIYIKAMFVLNHKV